MSNRTVIEAFRAEFHRYRLLAEQAMAQVSDGDLYTRLNPMQSSISAIIQQMHDGVVAHWTNFLNKTSGQARNDRDCVYIERGLPRDTLMGLWHLGWKRVFDTLESLCDADLNRVVNIKNETNTVAMAIAKQLAIHAWQAGQIALIARHVVGEEWRYFTIMPRGGAPSSIRGWRTNDLQLLRGKVPP